MGLIAKKKCFVEGRLYEVGAPYKGQLKSDHKFLKHFVSDSDHELVEEKVEEPKTFKEMQEAEAKALLGHQQKIAKKVTKKVTKKANSKPA